MKWGEQAENLKYKNAPKFIKFALGENVKQSNWGGRTRFPQTRMGVEQLYTLIILPEPKTTKKLRKAVLVIEKTLKWK